MGTMRFTGSIILKRLKVYWIIDLICPLSVLRFRLRSFLSQLDNLYSETFFKASW